MARPVEVRASIQDRMTSRLQRMDRQVNRFGRTWERAGRTAARGARLLSRGIDILDRGLHKLWRRARMAMLALQITASVMGGLAVSAALKYERALRSVFTLFKDAGSASKEMQDAFVAMDSAIRGISTRTKTTPQELAEGLYNVVSTGFDAAEGQIILENAARGAYAGLTDVETVTKLLTGTLQAYREEGESGADMAGKSAKMLDMFFNAVNVGVFTFEELAEKFGDVASSAAAFGVPLEDLLAFLSTATVRGIGLDEAITSARQTLLSIASSTPAAEEALGVLFGSVEKGKESFSAAALAEKGLIGVMEDLSAVIGTKIDARMVEMAASMEENGGDAFGFLAEKIGISVEAFSDLFPNIRALKGVLAVSGPGLETYGEHYEQIANNMGAVGRAAQEIDKSAAGALQGLKAVWEQFKIDVGNIALPWIKSIADGIVDWWGGVPERFAQSKGFEGPALTGVSADALERSGAQQRTAIAGFWAEAAPGEKIGFILKTAWSDAMDALNSWFDGEGKGKITSIGEKIGKFFGDALMVVAGVGGEDVENNVFFQIGQAGARGFIAGFKAEFDLGDAFGGMTSGDNPIGNVLMGYAGLKILGSLFKRGGGGAGGAAAGGGNFLSRFFSGGGARLTTMQGGTLVAGGALRGVAPYNQVTTRESGESQEHQIWRASTQGETFIDRWLKNLLGQVPAPEPAFGGAFNPDLQRSATSRHAARVAPGAAGGASAAVERGAGVISTAGGKMRLASLTMMAAASRLANTKLTVRMPGTGDPVRRMAQGGSGTVRRPTLFMAGEGGGAEDFSFTPHRKGGGRGGVTVNMGGVTLASGYDVKQMVSDLNREMQKAFGNG